jgi:predicted lipoprotein
VAIYRIIEITNYSICSVLQLAMIRCNMAIAVCCDVSRCAVERVPCAHEDVGTDVRITPRKLVASLAGKSSVFMLISDPFLMLLVYR